MKHAFIYSLVLASVGILPISGARADVIAEYFFYETMGDQVGLAARSYNDYMAERQLWRDNIASAKVQLEACGGCPAAQAELDKWQGIENQFQDVAGELARISGMPPLLANALGIDMPMTQRRAPLEGYGFDRASWLAQVKPECRPAGEAHFDCVDSFEASTGSKFRWSGMTLGVQHMCYDTEKLFRACSVDDLEQLALLTEVQRQRRAGHTIPEIIEEAWYTTVYFGDVPDDFELPLPPEAIVARHLAENAKGLQLVVRPRDGRSPVSALVRHFVWQDVAPNSTCFDGVNAEDVTQQAICADLQEISFRSRAPIIACEFTRAEGPRHLRDRTLNWYGARPALAERDRLTAISPEHPLLTVGEPRTSCRTATGSRSGYVMLQPGPTLEPGTQVFGIMFGPDPDPIAEALNLGRAYQGTVDVSEVYSMVMTGHAILMTEQQAQDAAAFGPLEEVGHLVPVEVPE